jgi:predicted RNase H-like HicB family nuclease
METYLIVIGKTRTGFSAHCPDVLGCGATGKTIDQVIKRMRDALTMHLDGLAEDGEPIPKPRGAKSYKEVLNDAAADQFLLAHVQVAAPRPVGADKN